MEKHRHGEEGSRLPFRTGRFFNIEQGWYFATREGKDHGPYSSKDDAEAALTMYLRDLNTFDSRLVDDDEVTSNWYGMR